jgi:3-deoxy-D-manno-octulosonate 8-phosphate phosphatase (KDO 8-P phosphatase)
MNINKLVLDVDGVLNTGHILYSSAGKMYKVFGPHDKDGFKIIKKYLSDITFITADVTGWNITYARIVKDWGYREDQLQLVTEEDRMSWFERNCDFATTAFIGDGYNDAPILRRVAVGIAPASARIEAKQAAKWVTSSPAGSGAVLDACLYLERVINGHEKI